MDKTITVFIICYSYRPDVCQFHLGHYRCEGRQGTKVSSHCPKICSNVFAFEASAGFGTPWAVEMCLTLGKNTPLPHSAPVKAEYRTTEDMWAVGNATPCHSWSHRSSHTFCFGGCSDPRDTPSSRRLVLPVFRNPLAL